MKQTIVYFVFYEQWTTEHFTEFIEEIKLKIKINTHTTEHIIFEFIIQFEIMTEQWKKNKKLNQANKWIILIHLTNTYKVHTQKNRSILKKKKRK